MNRSGAPFAFPLFGRENAREHSPAVKGPLAVSDTIRELVDTLCATGIVSRADMEDVLEETAATGHVGDPQTLTTCLSERGLISAFQAERLSHGEPLVINEYVLLQELGTGGMGRVFKARHQRMARMVVLKIIKEQHATTVDAVNRFNREIKSIAKLNHPHIVRAYDAGAYRDTPYLVMEYVEGEDLAHHVRNQGPLSVADAVDYVIQAATGLEYAHQQGIVHRDVKPGNLMLDTDGHIRVLDLGLAKPVGALTAGPDDVTDAMTSAGDIVGTAAYMAPEQAQNSQDVDRRSDIYSLGCTLYFLLTGEPVYAAESKLDRILAHRTAPPPALSMARDDVPPELDAVFHKMIAKRPEERFQCMTEVADALKRAVGVTQAASAADANADSSHSVRRKRAVLFALIGTVAVVCLALAIPLWPKPGPRVSPESPERSTDDSNTHSVAPPGIAVPNESEPVRNKEQDLDRRVAEAVIMAGGHVKVRGDGNSTYEVEELPANPFRVVEINLGGQSITDVPVVEFGQLSMLEYLNLADTNATGSEISAFGDSRSLRTVYLSGTAADDATIQSLSGIPTLQNLDLQGTNVTDVGLAHLDRCRQLQSLFVGQGQAVTDTGLLYISRIPNLLILAVRNAQITEKGLEHLTALHLDTLDLAFTDTDDAGLKQVCRIASLRDLSLSGTHITQSGLEHLSNLENLRRLNLSHTKLADSAIPYILQLSKLDALSLDYTDVSMIGKSRLLEALPNCNISILDR